MSVRRLIGAASAVGVLTAGSLLGATGLASAQEEQQKEWFTLSATGSGEEEVPAGSGEEGTTLVASISLTADGDMTYTVVVQGNSEEITAGHIHRGAKGANGPVIVPLDKQGDTYSVPAGRKLTPAQIEDLKKGNLYVNVHTNRNKGGEVRAQLQP